jgi:hypothetical protein
MESAEESDRIMVGQKHSKHCFDKSFCRSYLCSLCALLFKLFSCGSAAKSSVVKLPADSERLRLVNPQFQSGVFTPAVSCQANSFEPAAPPATSKTPREYPPPYIALFLRPH